MADPKTVQGSPERFGYSWERFAKPTPEQEEQFRRWTALIADADWRDAHVLDVGCGAGRNSLWVMRRGASGGIAIDVDDRSLDAARENLADFPQLVVRKLSIYDLQERDTFDIAFSIGVIHHLSDPHTAVARMTQAVRPGGRVLVWLYGYENNEWVVRYWDPLRKLLFSRLPLGWVHALSHFPTSLLWLALRSGLLQLEYFRMLRRFSYGHLRHIVFDHMIPKIAHYYRREQAEQLLKAAGLEVVAVDWVNQMSWTVLGIKPTLPKESAER